MATKSARPPRVVVIGSINMDLVARVPVLPRPGQTVLGHDLRESPGGKGANQAVAAARLGSHCAMVGCVGRDGFGERLRETLAAAGVNTDHVRRVEDCSSGVALIGVEAGGENAITIIPGANAHVRAEDVAAAEPLLRDADVLLLQLEIPLETVQAAVAAARCHGVLTILNPAPAPGPLPPALLAVDVLCPNESEAALLAGLRVDDTDDARKSARLLRQNGARDVIITLGARGALHCPEHGDCAHIPGFHVETVDTTGAGDAFAAGLGVGLAERRHFRDAVRFGCAVGALAVTRHGAQVAMPTREAVDRLLAENGWSR